MAGKTKYTDVYDHLILKGFDVYTPAQHKGECVTPYVVLKGAGVSQFKDYSSNQYLYDIMCYVPKERYTYLEEYVEQVEDAMRELEPMIVPLHYQTAPFYDDSVKAHMLSIQYRNCRRMKSKY